MSKIQKVYIRIKAGTASWKDFSTFLNLENKSLRKFFELAQKNTIRNFGNILKVYSPNKRFPAISITGDECALKCEHCNKKFLKGMKKILSDNDLERFLFELYESGGIGALISGGSERNGSVPILGFLETIKKVKSETNLIINTHTGLLNEETAEKLADAKVDIISFDINMDDKIVKEIYHLDVELEEYNKAVNLLKKYNLNIVPHICIGLYYGKLHKELDSIKFIKNSGINPSLIVIIVLIPPKKGKVKFATPRPVDVAKVIATTRFIFPKTEISLGCMRPRGKIKLEVEKYAIKAGITRIEIPSKKTLEWIKKIYPNIQFKFFSACCAIPQKFEHYAESKKSDIKRYLYV